MRARLLLLPLVVLVLIAPTCGGKDLGNEPSGQTIGAEVGYNAIEYQPAKRKPAPSWEGNDLRGAPITSASFGGSITVVNFWASWCVPCRTEQPALERLAQEYGDKGVLFVGVNIRDTTINAVAHIEEFGVTYPSVFNPDSTIAHDFRISYPPTTFVIDRAGKLAWKITGEAREEGLTKILDIELAR